MYRYYMGSIVIFKLLCLKVGFFENFGESCIFGYYSKYYK